jgi:hypothetical protein
MGLVMMVCPACCETYMLGVIGTGQVGGHVCSLRAAAEAEAEAGDEARREASRLRAENEALKRSWDIDCEYRDTLLLAAQTAYAQLLKVDSDLRGPYNWKFALRARDTLAAALSVDDEGESHG